MKISLVTLNYNSADEVLGLLETLKNQTDQNFKVIVADNNSNDFIEIKNRAQEVELIENGKNLGFAAGSNPALKSAFEKGADWVLLINPDTRVEPNFIAQLKETLAEKKGIVGIPLKEGDRTAYGGLIEWFKLTFSHAYRPIIPADAEMYYPIGGGLAISKEAYEMIGGPDEEYFLYFEDADYALKARANDIPVSFAYFPVIEHSVSKTTSKLGSPKLLRYHTRNALRFNSKRGSALVKVLVWPWSVYLFIKQFLKIMVGINRAQSRAMLAGVLDFWHGKMGQIGDDRIRIGLECENIEDPRSRWGVGRITLNLIEEYAADPELQKKYELILYFKNSLPADEIFKKDIFTKRVLNTRSFNWFYHVRLPLVASKDSLDWMFFPAYMLPPLYFKDSVVMLTGDVYHEYKHGSLPFRYRLAYGLFTNWAARFASKIMAISDTSAKEVAKLYKIEPERIFTAKLGVRTESARKENKYGDYILYVGQMFPRRHAKELILAFEKIVREFPNLKLILVGKDKYRPEVISKLVKNINQKLGLERIIHYDYIERDEDLRSLYAHARLFVYVSSHEAFGLPPVEAAAYGTPVFVKDDALNHELFGDKAYFIKNEKDVAETADILRKALKNERLVADVSDLTWQNFAINFFNNLK